MDERPPLIAVSYFKHEIDYRVSMAVGDLSLEEMNKLMSMATSAIWQAWEIYRNARMAEQPAAKDAGALRARAAMQQAEGKCG